MARRGLYNLLKGSPATTSKPGVVKQAVVQAASGAAPTQAEFNALLTKLKDAGIMASS